MAAIAMSMSQENETDTSKLGVLQECGRFGLHMELRARHICRSYCVEAVHLLLSEDLGYFVRTFIHYGEGVQFRSERLRISFLVQRAWEIKTSLGQQECYAEFLLRA